MKAMFVVFFLVVEPSLAEPPQNHDAKIVHPHDQNVKELLAGDKGAIILHWGLLDRVKDEAAGNWMSEVAFAAAYMQDLSINRTPPFQMPQWAYEWYDGDAFSLNRRILEMHFHIPTGEKFEFMSKRIGTLMALIYMDKFKDYFTAERKAEVGKLLLQSLSNIELEEYPFEKCAWVAAKAGLKGNETREYYAHLLSKREYQRAAVVACRYQLGLHLLEMAVVGEPPRPSAQQPRKVVIDIQEVRKQHSSRLSWYEWVKQVKAGYQNSTCPENLWHDLAPVDLSIPQ